jgi:hypothetical protein
VEIMTIAYLFLAAVIVAALCFGLIYLLRSRQKYGGERVIICPETGKQAMVEVDTRRAALTSLLGQTDLRRQNCWRWPIKQDCGQECLLQLKGAPDECLVRSVLEKWYLGKECVFCDRPFEKIDLIDHKPALLNSEGITIEWKQIPLPAVMEAMGTYQAVCWNCHIAQTFYREHPDLVVERSPLVQQVSDRVM